MRPGSNTGLGLRKGAWAADEDTLLKNYIEKYGEGKWHLVPLKAGLKRCRKSCRLRWLNYLRPNIKRGNFGKDEIDLILRLHKLLGNRWSLIAGRIPGRTANDVKNYWNTHLCLRSKQQKREPKDDESLQDTRVTIIKPQPRSYSKPLNGCMGDYPDIVTQEAGGKQRSLNEFANNLNMSTGLISTSNILLDHENVNEYLDSFIDDYEDEIGGKLGWSFSGTDSANEKALNGVQQEDDQISLFDFPMDEVTWDFINSD